MTSLVNMMTDRFLHAIHTVEEKGDSHNGILDIVEVRRECRLSKVQFNSTAIALMHEGVVTLCAYDDTSSLTIEQRELLVYRRSTNQYFYGIYRNR